MISPRVFGKERNTQKEEASLVKIYERLHAWQNTISVHIWGTKGVKMRTHHQCILIVVVICGDLDAPDIKQQVSCIILHSGTPTQRPVT